MSLGNVLVWVGPEADAEIRIGVQMVNPGGEPRKHWKDVR